MPIPKDDRMLNIISLGAGVQSSTMALMANNGEITPMPDAAIFADTRAEPATVYRWLDWLETQLPFPVYRVSRGSLLDESLLLRKSSSGGYHTLSSPPAFMSENGKSTGLLMRQCTRDFKLRPIYKQCTALRRSSGISDVSMWIGISTDETHRMKPSREKWCTNRWPLIEMGMQRRDCLEWMKSHKYPIPPRSACVFCPFHNDGDWRRMNQDAPDEFEIAVKYERDLQKTMSQVNGFRGVPFLHRSCHALDSVEFDKTSNQLSFFGNECEGLCGV